jgi:hypothetical protein
MFETSWEASSRYWDRHNQQRNSYERQIWHCLDQCHMESGHGLHKGFGRLQALLR